MDEKLIRINNSAKNKQEVNEAKKDTGSIWKKNEMCNSCWWSWH